MAGKANIPAFGDWEHGDTFPYSQYFDNARKARTSGQIITPNGASENSEAFPEEAVEARAPPYVSIYSDSPRNDTKSLHHLHGDRTPPHYPQRRPNRTSGSDRSMETSPRRTPPHQHQRRPKRTSGSDRSLETSPHRSRGQGRSPKREGSAPGTPGRLKPRSPRNEPVEKNILVPRFGDWDESNPSSADGFTDIFNKVREEKHTGSTKAPIVTTGTGYGGDKVSITPAAVSISCYKQEPKIS